MAKKKKKVKKTAKTHLKSSPSIEKIALSKESVDGQKVEGQDDGKFTIVCDTREQDPFTFRASKYCAGTINKKVEHGDYSLVGFEHLIFLERKASPAEVAGNVIQERFKKLMLASEAYKYRYIVCEFSLDKLLAYPYGNGLPKSVVRRIRVRGAYVLSKLMGYEIDHGAHIIFCENKVNAQKFTLALLKKIYDRENQ